MDVKTTFLKRKSWGDHSHGLTRRFHCKEPGIESVQAAYVYLWTLASIKVLEHQDWSIDQVIWIWPMSWWTLCVQKTQRTSGGGFLVLYVEGIPLIGNNDGKIVSNGSMVSHLVRYEGLRKSQSRPWDQVRSSDKDVWAYPKSPISTLFLPG